MVRFPIVILHGWGANKTRWERVRSLLRQKGFRVFVPDLPGFGREPDPSKAWGLDEYASWVLKKAKEKGFKRFVLIGHSFGGSVAVKMAVNFPEEVKKLILVNSAGVRISKSSLKMRVWLLVVGLGQFVFTLPVIRHCRDLVRLALYRALGSVDYFRAQGVKKEILKKVFTQDIQDDLSKVNAPALIIWAQKDRQTPLKWAEIFHQGIPNSQLKIVERAGHVFPYYESEKFVNLIESFLKT